MKTITITIQSNDGPREVDAIVLPCGLAIHQQAPTSHALCGPAGVVPFTLRVAIIHVVSGRKVMATHTVELAQQVCRALENIDWTRPMGKLAGNENAADAVDEQIRWHDWQMWDLHDAGVDIACEEPVTLEDV